LASCVRPTAPGRRGQFVDAHDVAEADGAFHVRVVVGQEHAAFAGGRELRGLQAEDADVAEPSAGHAARRGAEGVRGILDHLQAVPAGHADERVDLRGQAPQVHDHHRLRARRDASLDVGGIEREALALDLAEDRHEAHPQHRDDRRPERGRGHEHLVAGLQVESVERREQAQRAVGVRQGVPAADPPPEIVFEGTRHRMVRKVAVPQHLEHGRLVVGLHDGPAVGGLLVERDGGRTAEDGWPCAHDSRLHRAVADRGRTIGGAASDGIAPARRPGGGSGRAAAVRAGSARSTRACRSCMSR
jgi:hypothetical protein